MLCKWCGLESDTTDVCSWCQRPLGTAPSAPNVAPGASSVAPPPISSRPRSHAVLLGDTVDLEAPPVAAPVAASLAGTSTASLEPLAAGAGSAAASSKQDVPYVDPDTPPVAAERQLIPIRRPGIARGAPASEAPPQASAATADPPVTPLRPRTPLAPDSPAANVGLRAEAVRPNVPSIAPQPMAAVATSEPVPAQLPQTYYCKWCGLDSINPSTCSWCKRDMRVVAAPRGKSTIILTGKHPGTVASKLKTVSQPGAGRETALSTPSSTDLSNGQPAPTPVGQQSPNGAAAMAAVPAIGSFTAAKSRYYPEMVTDPISGAHYNADTGQTVEGPVLPLDYESDTSVRNIGLNVGVLALLAMLGGLAASANHQLYLPALAVTNVIAGFAMPLLRTVPFAADDQDDIGWALAFILLFGPFIGLIVYGLVCMIKQDANPAIVGVFVSSIVLRMALDKAVGVPGIMLFGQMLPSLTLVNFVARWIPLVTLAGWYFADTLKKTDE